MINVANRFPLVSCIFPPRLRIPEVAEDVVIDVHRFEGGVQVSSDTIPNYCSSHSQLREADCHPGHAALRGGPQRQRPGELR